MTNEDFERAIDFLLKSQAKSEARIEQTNEQLARTDERVTRLAEQVSQLSDQLGAFAYTQADIMRVVTRTFEAQAHINESLRAGINELAARQSQTEESLAKLADRQSRTEETLAKLAEAQARTDEALKQLAESQTHTDRRLDALIDILRGGRNGK